MNYTLSIVTALVLVGAGCASTPATPQPAEPSRVPPSTQIESPANTATAPTPTTIQETKQGVVPTVDMTPSVTPTPAPPVPATVKSYTMAEVAAANTESNCLTVINGIVYNLTVFVNKHPGGDRNILRICGKDGTSAFNGQHGGESKPENMLATFDVGVLTQ